MQSKKDMLDRKAEKRAEAMRQSLMKRKQQVRARADNQNNNDKDENQNGNDNNGTN